MSKQLHAVATKHRPLTAAKMTAENGYDETKHKSGADLHAAGVISADEGKDLDDCLEDLKAGGMLDELLNGDLDDVDGDDDADDGEDDTVDSDEDIHA